MSEKGLIEDQQDQMRTSFVRSYKFWFWFVVLLLPFCFFFALPGAIFVDRDTPPVFGIVILVTGLMLGFLVPFIIARRIALAHLHRRSVGFPIAVSPRAYADDV